jgi:hypothetical protein
MVSQLAGWRYQATNCMALEVSASTPHKTDVYVTLLSYTTLNM